MTSVLQSQHEHYAEVRRRLSPFSEAPAVVIPAVVVREIAPPKPERPQSVISYPSRWRPIAEAVCEARGVKFEDMISFSRLNDLVIARHEVWALMRKDLRWSYPRIGRAFGPFDHTSVISGIRSHYDREQQAGIDRVWKGTPTIGFVSQTAAIVTLTAQGKSPRQILSLTGLTKKQVSAVISDQHKRARAAVNG